MLILLYGSDTFRSQKKLEEIVERYRVSGKTGLNQKIYQGEFALPEDLEQELRVLPMFKERKLLVLKGVFQNSAVKQFLLSRKKALEETDSIFVFIEEGNLLAKDPLFQFLFKKGKVQKFSPLAKNALSAWAIQESRRYGIGLSSQALAELFSLHGNNLWGLAGEIQKQAAFKRTAKNKTVSLADIQALSSQASFETDIFQTIAAVSQRDKEKALLLIHRHLTNGDSPLYLLSMIHWQVRNVMQAKHLKAGEKSSLHPFALQKSRALAERFTSEELMEMYERLWRTDLHIKTGARAAEAALDELVLQT